MQTTAEAPRATARTDAVAFVLILLIAVGWFLLNTLVFSVGRVAQPTRFYQMLAILNHPAMLLFGVSGASAEVALFSLLCVLVLLAALLPYRSARRSAWLASWLPLLLMLVCLIALYTGGAPERAAQAPSGASLGGELLRLANAAVQGAMQSAQGQVAHHISPGAGGVVSLLASAALAVRCSFQRR